MSQIYNPSLGNVYFGTGGSAITSQPTIDIGSLIGSLNSAITNPRMNGLQSSHDAVKLSGMRISMDSSGTRTNPGGSEFAYETPNTIRGVSTTLGGNANTLLRYLGSDYGRVAIHKIESDRTAYISRAIREGDWTPMSGWSTNPSVGTTAFGNDDAARPTAEKPGEYVHRDGSAIPTTGDYSSRNLW